MSQEDGIVYRFGRVSSRVSQFCANRKNEVNPKLVPLKITFFLYWGGMAVLNLYSTIFMQWLGLSTRLIGLVYAFGPVSNVAQVCLLNLTDRFNKRSSTLVIFLICLLALSTGFYSIPRRDPDSDQSTDSIDSIFYFCLAVRLVLDAFLCGCYNLIDSIAIILLAQNSNAKFGTQKLFSTLGTGVFPLLAGLIMDNVFVDGHENVQLHDNSSMTNYTREVGDTKRYGSFLPLIVIIDVNLLVAAFIVYKWLSADNNRTPVANTVKRSGEMPEAGGILKSALLKPRNLPFWLIVLTKGICMGLIVLFVPMRMTTLGAEKTLVGAAQSISTICGLLALLVSDEIIKRLGHLNVLNISVLCYSGRFFLYSYLRDPRWFLLGYALDSVTYFTSWNTILMYSTSLAPLSIASTLIAVSACLHFSAGFALAGLIGGFTIAEFGFELSFRIFSYVTLCVAAAFGLTNLILVRIRKQNENGGSLAEPETKRSSLLEEQTAIQPEDNKSSKLIELNNLTTSII